jgi:hypothetical protein
MAAVVAINKHHRGACGQVSRRRTVLSPGSFE